jgi:hypothetical protein
VKLVHAEHYSRIADAAAAERRIKGWSRPQAACHCAAVGQWCFHILGSLIGMSFEASGTKIFRAAAL